MSCAFLFAKSDTSRAGRALQSACATSGAAVSEVWRRPELQDQPGPFGLVGWSHHASLVACMWIPAEPAAHAP